MPSRCSIVLINAHAAADCVARCAREHAENRGRAVLRQDFAAAFDVVNQRDEKILARNAALAGEIKRRRERRDFAGELRVIHIDADAGDDRFAIELRENAGALAVADQNVVGPAQIGRETGDLRDRLLRRRAPARASPAAGRARPAAGAARSKHRVRHTLPNARRARDVRCRRPVRRRRRWSRRRSRRGPVARRWSWWS